MNQGYTYRERIDVAGAGRTLIEHLAGRYPHSTRQVWDERIASGEVQVEEATARPEQTLRAGERVVWHRPPWEEPDVPLQYELLHEDEALLAVAKPEGLPTIPGGGEFLEHTLLHQVRRRFANASPMHRLGRGTSGIVLFARTGEAGAKVQEAWRTRGQVEKTYRALVCGAPDQDLFEVTVPIGPVPHRVLGTVHAAAAGGRPSRSVVRVLGAREAGVLVEVDLDTGRPHQIRIHLAAAGHPLVGDLLYPVGGVPPPETTVLPGDLGYRLHHLRLSLPHPDDGHRLSIECPAPPGLL